MWVDSLAVGGVPVADAMDLSTWKSLTEAVPIPVEGWHVSLVAFTPGGDTVWVGEVPLADGFTGSLSGAALDAVIGTLGVVRRGARDRRRLHRAAIGVPALHAGGQRVA